MSLTDGSVKLCRICGNSSVPLSVVMPEDDGYAHVWECMLYELTSTGKSFRICMKCKCLVMTCVNGIITRLSRTSSTKTNNSYCCFLCGTRNCLRGWIIRNTDVDRTILERIKLRFGYKTENLNLICTECELGFMCLFRIHFAVSQTTKTLNYSTKTISHPQVSDARTATDQGGKRAVTPFKSCLKSSKSGLGKIGKSAAKRVSWTEEIEIYDTEILNDDVENDNERDKTGLQPSVQEKVLPSPVIPLKSCLKTSKSNPANANLSEIGQSALKRVAWTVPEIEFRRMDLIDDSDAEEYPIPYYEPEPCSSEYESCVPTTHKEELFDQYNSKSKGSTIQEDCDIIGYIRTQEDEPHVEIAEGDVDTISSGSNDPKMTKHLEEPETSCEIDLRELSEESESAEASNNKHSDTSCDVSSKNDLMPDNMEKNNNDDMIKANAQSIVSLLKLHSDVVDSEVDC